MSLKDYRDDWETWSKGKKIISLIAGCCILTFVLLMIAGMFLPDANDTYDPTDGDSYTDEDGPFEIEIDNVSVVDSSISKIDFISYNATDFSPPVTKNNLPFGAINTDALYLEA